jgi:hypothetical protein
MRKIHFKIVLVAFLLNSITSGAQAQKNRDGSMPQYLFPDFNQCVISMKNGEKKTLTMNFNTITEKLVFYIDPDYFDLMNSETIDTVYLNSCKFIPVGKSFYEVLISGPIALFIQHKGDLLEKGAPVGYGGTSQLAKSVYVTTYSSDGRLYLKLFPDKGDEIKNFIKEFRLKIDRREDLIKVVNYAGSIK